MADRLLVVRDQHAPHAYSVCRFATGARFLPRERFLGAAGRAGENAAGMRAKPVAIIGAGPAGLTAAYLLSKEGVPVTVLEADPELVGGIARTASYKGYHFDIGGHRFFSKSKEVEDLWTELLPDDMLDRPRSSRIFYRGKFFAYPLKARRGAAASSASSSRRAACCRTSRPGSFPVANPQSFEDWVTQPVRRAAVQHLLQDLHREGVGHELQGDLRRLGRPAHQGAVAAARPSCNALFPKQKPQGPQGKVIKTLIDSFRYPRKGPGMMWEACAREGPASWAATSQMGQKVVGCHYDAGRRACGPSPTRTPTATGTRSQAEHVISSAPMRELRQRPHAARVRATPSQAADALQVPRLPHGGADPQGPQRVRRQLDLHPRSRA